MLEDKERRLTKENYQQRQHNNVHNFDLRKENEKLKKELESMKLEITNSKETMLKTTLETRQSLLKEFSHLDTDKMIPLHV